MFIHRGWESYSLSTQWPKVVALCRKKSTFGTDVSWGLTHGDQNWIQSGQFPILKFTIWPLVPHFSYFVTNIGIPSGNQMWQWTNPPFIDDFPTETFFFYGRFCHLVWLPESNPYISVLSWWKSTAKSHFFWRLLTAKHCLSEAALANGEQVNSRFVYETYFQGNPQATRRIHQAES